MMNRSMREVTVTKGNNLKNGCGDKIEWEG
jgi:hypothetical protein